MDYILVFLSVILMSFGFVLQKVYQKKAGPWGGASFSVYSAVFCIISLLAIGGFTMDFSWYSLINAALKSLCGFLYTIIGFHIMAKGCVALYMLFLMSGGMVLPVLWGWIFLDEPVAIMRVLGVGVIIAAIILTRDKEEKAGSGLIIPLMAIFFLNGMVSVFSKLHQIETIHRTVETATYAVYSAGFSFLMSLTVMLFRHRKHMVEDTVEDHPTTKSPVTTTKQVLLLIGIVALYSLLGSISSLLQLEGAKNLDASVLYPMITGGTIVLTGIMALIFFGEKPSKREWISIGLCLAGTFMFLE